MKTAAFHSNNQTERESRPNPFVCVQTFDAPRDVVWRAWTDQSELKRWFGPKGFTIPACTLELRPGGVFHYCLQATGGQQMWGKWVFREVAAPETLETIVSFSDPDGGITRHPMSALWPLETLSTMTLTEADAKTTLSLTWSAINATEEEEAVFNQSHEGMRVGCAGTMDQLAAYLETQKSSAP